jgi:hypothetical protein
MGEPCAHCLSFHHTETGTIVKIAFDDGTAAELPCMKRRLLGREYPVCVRACVYVCVYACDTEKERRTLYRQTE